MSKPRTQAKPPPRVRRTAADARTEIMDATEKRLVASGPKGIRIQDVAADVGVSHPTILHHFGSREHLVEAVIRRRVGAMKQDVILALLRAGQGEATMLELFERLYTGFHEGGHARVVAFLALDGGVPGAEPESVRPLAEAAHVARLAHTKGARTKPPFEDTYFTIMLATLALFGEAIVGPLLRGESEGAPDLALSKRFREWTARLLIERMEQGVTPSGKTKSKSAAR